jgi:hypothetical protein
MAAGKLKVVVFGSYDAGKSTFIQAIDPGARHVEAHTMDGDTTVALDFGRTNLHNLQVFLFGTPGQDRFEFVRQTLAYGMDAAILVVDCSVAVDDFTRQLYRTLVEQGIPLAVMLNKCDLSEACPALARRELDSALLYEISATRPESARNALAGFIGTLVKDL